MKEMTNFIGKKIVFQTLGCKLNFAESSSLGKKLLSEVFVRFKNGEQADVVIINTCSVTDTADKKGRQLIHRMIKKYPNAFIVVTGCFAQLKPNDIAEIEGVDMVLGANEKIVLEEFISSVEKKNRAVCHVVKTSEIRNFTPECSADDRTRHFLKVQDGCNYYCTYCTIPFARGRSRSASVAETVAVAEEAIANGAKEIVLTGVNTGDFGFGTQESFFDLIKALDNIDAQVRYRISSIEPNLLTDDIIRFVSNSDKFAHHFHIPLQSGSDELLKLMRRKYDTSLFRYKIELIKSLMPHAFIGVDVMVGVRGETPELFNESKNFISSLDVSQLHVFTYSERAGTKALEIPYIVPIVERKRRNAILQKISDEKLEKFYNENKGRKEYVLWEDSKNKKIMSGFSGNYIKVEAPYNADMINTFTEVIL